MAVDDNATYGLKGSQIKKIVNEIGSKQDTLTAGTNVDISNNVISATDTTYSAGSGLNLNGTQFSVDTDTIQTKLTFDSTPTADSGNPVTSAGIKNYVDTASITFKPFPDTVVTDGTTSQFITSVQNLGAPTGMAYLGTVTLSDMPASLIQEEVEVYVYDSNIIYCIMRSADTSPYEWWCCSYDYAGWRPVNTDTTYSAGTGLNLNGTTFSVDTSAIQEKLTAGNNISISNNTISATDTTYSAGTGLDLTGTTFSVDSTIATKSEIPTKTSDVTNDGSDGTSTYVEADELATVATTGSYSDLSNKPTIGNATITLQKNGTTVDTFTTNATSNKSINIGVPTKTSDLTNDGSDNTSTYVEADELAAVATSGNYSDLQGKPTVDSSLNSSSNNAVANSAVSTALNDNVVTGVTVNATPSTTTVQLDNAKKNLYSGSTTTTSITLPVASTTQAGVMNSSTFDAVTANSNNINALMNGAVAITGLSANPSQSDLTTAWLSETGLSALINRASIYDVTNEKVWTYYTNDTTWHVASNTTQVTVNTWTNSSEGVVKGSTNDGQIFAESDGTGSVNGWDTLTGTVAGHTSKLATIAQGAEVNVQANWNETNTSSDAYIQNKPTIPTVNNATLTIQKNGTSVGTFTANASSNTTANITVPTKTSDLNNDSGFIDKSVNDLTYYTPTSSLATVATTGSYSDLTNKPSIPAAQIQSNWTQSDNTKLDYIKNKPSLATVATSGSYNDLSNKPTIPAAQVNSDWDAVSGVSQILNKPSLATVATTGSYTDLSNKPTIPTVNNATLTIQKNGTTVQTFTANSSSNKTANISVPTKVSELTNDSGFITGVAWGDVTNKPSFATVATSGSYNDLSNKPTIPTVNNATLTVQNDGVSAGTFTANASSNATINIVPPVKISNTVVPSTNVEFVSTANIQDNAVTTAKLGGDILTTHIKAIATASKESSSSITSGNIIPLKLESSIGSGLSMDSQGRFVIGSGISYVLVSASWSADASSTTGFRRVHIRKNQVLNNAYAFTTTANTTGYISGAIASILIPVEQGDIIDLYNRDTTLTFWTSTRMSITAF